LILIKFLGLIVVNKNYEKAPEDLKLKNIEFAYDEASRIENFFKNFCEEVTVM
jgi:hypothetical protein